MYTINVVDAPCGHGKSSSLINYINDESNNEKRFLYITPFLTEVERIKNSCSEKKFKDPKSYGTKLNGVKYLFSKGENIVSTHSLFRLFDEETIELAYLNNYTLVMDEVADVVEVLNISSFDLETLLEKYTEQAEDGTLIWTATEYRGEFEEYKRICELGCVSVYGSGKSRIILLWMFPISVFKAFKEIFILSYLFDAQIQKYYYDYYGVEYKYLYVKDFKLTEEIQDYSISKYKDLFNICTNDKLNMIGDLNGSLSKSWFDRNRNSKLITSLKNNCYNYFRNITNTPSELNMWSTFKEHKNLIKGAGYSKGFVSLSMRATNDYMNKESVAYLANRYLNPVVKNFFISKGVSVDEDKYALSELLQLVFRSRIRVGKPINIYVPSKRTREILINWLNS